MPADNALSTAAACGSAGAELRRQLGASLEAAGGAARDRHP